MDRNHSRSGIPFESTIGRKFKSAILKSLKGSWVGDLSGDSQSSRSVEVPFWRRIEVLLVAAIWLLNGALPVLLWEGPLNLYGKWFLWQFFLGLLGLWWFWDYHRLIRRLKAMGQKFSSWVGQAGEEPISSLWWPSLKGAIQAVRDKLLESRRRLAHELEQSKALMHSLDDAVLALDCQEKLCFLMVLGRRLLCKNRL